MNAYTLSYTFGKNQQGTRFRIIGYTGIDYLSEACARRRMMMNFLELPVPFQLLSNIYPHNGHLQDIKYRAPWSNKVSTCKLHVTGSVMEDLMENTRFGDSLERFDVFQVQTGSGLEEVVPSSNPASQCSIGDTEALWDIDKLESSENRSTWDESFSPCMPDAFCFSCNDLTLPEDVIFADHLMFKSHLPSIHTMLQRLKVMTVSDPLLHLSVMPSEDIIFRHCASYTEVLDKVPDTAVTGEVTEVFIKETVLNEESLMLPVEVLMESVQRQEVIFSFAKLQDLLSLIPEPMEEKETDLQMKGDEHKTEVEVLQIQESSCTYDSFKEPNSPVALRVYTEMELDLVLSPCNDTLPNRFLSTEQLSAEQLSPVYKQHLLSDSECENMEKAVWMAEKHHKCVAGFLLAEPQTVRSSIHYHTLPDLLMLLTVKREHVESNKNIGQFYLTDITAVLPEPSFTDLSVYTENNHTAKIEALKNETFSPLSIMQIDEMLFAVHTALPHPDGPIAAQPNHLQTAETVQVDLHVEKTVKPFRTEQISCQAKTTKETDCYTAQVKQQMSNPTSFKPTKPERCSEIQRNCSVTTCTSGEQLNISEVLEMFKSSPLRHKHTEVISTVTKPPEQRREGTTCKSVDRSKSRHVNSSAAKSHQSLDPFSSFIWLRTLQKSPIPTPQKSSPTSTEMNVSRSPRGKALPVLRVNAADKVLDSKNNITATETRVPSEERPISRTIHVQATETQRNAYRELKVLGLPCLNKAHESGVSGLNNRDFDTLSPELTRFLLKQQERTRQTQQGGDCVLDDITLLHILVTLKELLLKSDLHAAIDYLARVKTSCALNCLDELMKKFEVLLYLSRKRPEPDPKLLELQDQISTWMNSHLDHNTRALVLTVNTVTTKVFAALRQVLGDSVYALVPKEGNCKVTSREVMESLSRSRCVLLCRQHIGPDFPWQSFILVFEIHCVDHSPFSSVCSERNITYISFSTAVPEFNGNTVSYLDSIPFVLFVTDGLLKHSRIQRALETTYDMTLLERKHPPCAQKLGGADYDVITVDENTAVLIQEVSELEMEKASSRVVMRLSALSLQFTRCWLILHCDESHRALISSSVYLNLVVIYSSFVLFGHKSKKFDVKVLLVCEEEEIARYIYQICLHTLMSSDRDALSWLDRDWLSVQPTDAEHCLLQFPCINPLVAQLMLTRAPSLQWLLRASLVELQEMLSQVPHKVIKLFSDITAKHNMKMTASESENKALQTNIFDHHHPQRDVCHSQQPVYFTESLSGQQEDKMPPSRFCDLIGQSLCRQEDHISDRAQASTNSHTQLKMGPFSQDSASLNVWQTQDEGRIHLNPDLVPKQAAVLSGPQVLDSRNSVCEVSCRRQRQTHWRSPENITDQKTAERKRQRTEDVHTVFPHYKRGKLLCEKVPGRNDGQTRLSISTTAS
nr:T-cell acute lymphocytic leukemia protein 2 isoform X2 [Misgurnus anguillicaudatus]